ncbi:MAG: excinuclease ABC subunit B [Parcubacteria group bacterium Gr01-1014_70]|nr:MAG: excinuclease ABC subunit B [Parcubacteria group bacterium Gr01-1014_70]
MDFQGVRLEWGQYLVLYLHNNMQFQLKSQYQPTGDQPQAIAEISARVKDGVPEQTLIGVTGSGKTFTMANVIERVQMPTLVISHNKTLAAQLYQEFKEFFPDNAVHYFVSYYDYYQPEAYLPQTDTYIEKDAKINDFIDRLRHASTQALLTRRDVIIVASVSCIYGLGDPAEYGDMSVSIRTGQKIKQNDFLRTLASLQYERNDTDPKAGTFSVKGDIVEIVSPTGMETTRLEFLGNEIEHIYPVTFSHKEKTPKYKEKSTTHNLREAKPYKSNGVNKGQEEIQLFPAKHFVTTTEHIERAIANINQELDAYVETLRRRGKVFEAERLRERTRFDMEMLRTTGYCSGIENYSRHISFRNAGEPSSTLLDYFPKDFLTFIDESHMTIPQIHGMYHGDRARKQVLIEHGFRLPSALDNRPLMFEEFENRVPQVVYVSATPGQFELSSGPASEQLVRPTGLLDPDIEIRSTKNQIHDVAKEIKKRAEAGERTFVTTITKRLAEDIAEYLSGEGIHAEYIHAEVKTLQRTDILQKLRKGEFDALVGINLLREGLDIPEVSLVAILDADKEGFLRNAITLIQTMGRAARHLHGHVILYANSITKSMREAIETTKRRRNIQETYNKEHSITPQPIQKEIRDWFSAEDKKSNAFERRLEEKIREHGADRRSLTELRKELETEMLEAAAALDFERAAKLRDALGALTSQTTKQNKPM